MAYAKKLYMPGYRARPISPTCPTALTALKRLVTASELRPIRAGSGLGRACVVARLPITTFAVPSAARALSNRSQ